MKIHPLLNDPLAVAVLQFPLAGPPGWDDFRRAGCQAMRALRIELEDEKALIKPNVTSGEHIADPDTGITTHPGFVQGLIDYLLEQDTPARKITIAEDPRDTDDNQPRHWQGTGYERVAQQSGVRLHCPTSYTCVKKAVPQPQALETLKVSRLAVDPRTALFNVPKLKTHNLAITTLGMKNLMGLVNVFDRHFCLDAWDELPEAIRDNQRPRREWFEPWMHELWQLGLARRLVDTAQVIRPNLNIIEGIVGREGTGFQRGRNCPLGLVIAGVNIVAVDALASYLMGFDPQRLIYLDLAAEAGLGENDIRKLKVYTLEGEQLTCCADPASLRVTPPFCAITNVKGEAPASFTHDSAPVVDPSDTFFNKSHA